MPPGGTHKKQQPRQKHIPQRMCVICRASGDKKSLTRIVRTSETSFAVDPTGRANGRGAYVCESHSCWEKAASTAVLAKALRVEPDDESIRNLKEFAVGLHLVTDAPALTASEKEKAS